MTRAKVPHPGWACCNPDFDLSGWVSQRRAVAREAREVASDFRDRGRQFRELELLTLKSQGYLAALHWQRLSVDAHGEANAHAQDALMIDGHVSRVVAGHPWRFA